MHKGLISAAGKITATMRGIIYLLVITACAVALIAVWKDRNLFETAWLCASLIVPAIGGQVIQGKNESVINQQVDTGGSA